MLSEPTRALALFQQAYALLPEPRTSYYDSIWLLRDIGHMQFRLGRYAEGKATLMTAVQEVSGALRLAEVHMHLGQCLFELGEPGAEDWLASAYLLEGPEVFRHEDPKYLAHVRELLDRPAGPLAP
jgi:tetratricopeptide (TPR) repeat protein